MRKVRVGDVVRYRDSGDPEGTFHNALVIHVWETSVNIVFISPIDDFADTVGNERLYRTSVPWKEQGMSGNYVE